MNSKSHTGTEMPDAAEAARYRRLTRDEIRRLERQGCTAGDWQVVEVHPDIDLGYLAHVHFSGPNRIGRFRKSVALPGGITLHTGIRHATLHDVRVGDDCLIAHVDGYIARYDIAPGCVILHTDTIAMDGPSAFGNGTELHVMSEGGGRDIVIHDRLSSQEAYMQAMYRHDADFTRNLRKLASDYARGRKRDRGSIGENARIVRCGLIRDVEIGSCSRLEGAVRLENGTVCSRPDAPTFVGDLVTARDFILQAGSRVGGGATLDRCHVGQASVVGCGFSAADSYFACNCRAERGEACAILAGPYTVTHHKSTLLIGGMFSFMNAGSGTNQSNHAYKLGPIHHGVLERGCKTASGSHIAWPAHIGAFSLVMGHCASGTNTAEWPFSYLVERGSARYVIPGIALRGVGTWRDIAKWPVRDGRPSLSPRTDLVSFEAFSPYTMERVFRARASLEELAGRFKGEAGEIPWKGLRLKEISARQGMAWYGMASDRYLGEQLLRRLEAHENTPPAGLRAALRPRATCGSRWGDIGGMLAPMSEIDGIVGDVASGRIDRLDGLEERLRLVHERYDEFAWAWTWNLLHEIYPDAREGNFVASLCLPVIRKWEAAAATLNRLTVADARKDVSPDALAGFGIDGDEETAAADARAVRSTAQGCGIIRSLEKQQAEIEEKAAYWLKKLVP